MRPRIPFEGQTLPWTDKPSEKGPLLYSSAVLKQVLIALNYRTKIRIVSGANAKHSGTMNCANRGRWAPGDQVFFRQIIACATLYQ
jgi:hypothetical protein